MKSEKDLEVISDTSLVVKIPRIFIRPDPNQPRKHFDKDLLGELANSIHSVGQVVPVIVRKLEEPERLVQYELIDGERRWLACDIAQEKYLKAIVVKIDNKDEQFKQSIIANFCREGHTPTETAFSVKRLQDMGNTLAEIAKMCGKSSTWVVQYLSITKLCPEVLALLSHDIEEEDRLSFSTALLLVKVSPEFQLELAKVICNNHMTQFQARNLIAKTVCQNGGGRLVEEPCKEFEVVFGHTLRAKNWAKTVVEMGEDRLREILKGGKLQKRIMLLEIADEAEKSFAKLKTLFSKHLFPKESGKKK